MPTLKSNLNDYSHPSGAAATGFEVKLEEAMTLQDWQNCSQPNQPWCVNPQDANSVIVHWEQHIDLVQLAGSPYSWLASRGAQ